MKTYGKNQHTSAVNTECPDDGIQTVNNITIHAAKGDVMLKVVAVTSRPAPLVSVGNHQPKARQWKLEPVLMICWPIVAQLLADHLGKFL